MLEIEQDDIIKIVNGVCSVLSLVGELFIIFVYFRTPVVRTFPMKLVISLIFSNLGGTITNLISYLNYNSLVCSIEGFFRAFFGISGVIWAFMILLTSYKQLKNYNGDLNKIYPRLLITNMGISMIPSAVTLISQLNNGSLYFGSFFGFCGILPNNYGMFLVEIPLWSGLALAVVYVIRLMFLLKDIYQTKTVMEYRNALVYPALLIISWLPDLSYRLYYQFIGEYSFVLFVLHIACTRIQGFLNVIVFGKINLKSYKRTKIEDSQSSILDQEAKDEINTLSLVSYY